MQALVKFGKGRDGMELEASQKPLPSDGEVLIRVKAVGICGSDIPRHERREKGSPTRYPRT